MTHTNVFDPKAALLAKHAQHVVLIHFPIALFLTGVAFDFVVHFSRRSSSLSSDFVTKAVVLAGPNSTEALPWASVFASAACVNLIGAAVFALPVVASGLLAWQWQLEGEKLHGILLLHLVLGCTSAALILGIGWIHLRATRASAMLPAYRLPLEIFAAVLIILTGHLGGFLSGVNVPG